LHRPIGPCALFHRVQHLERGQHHIHWMRRLRTGSPLRPI
jgi:hypothetical protein